MLTIRAMRGGAGYSERHLQCADYYDKDHQIKGQWFGQGAERLGLSGEVTHEQFESLRQCEDPQTGKFLRQRRGAERVGADGKKQSEPVAFYDFTLSAPKSVSIMAVMEDPRILDAHRKAVADTVGEMEQHAAVEDKRDGKKEVRQTGNLAIAAYEHDTARGNAPKKDGGELSKNAPSESTLDPQLHHHLVLFNLSHDAESGKWKALDARGLYQRRAYFTEVYRNILARELRALGYEVENRWNAKESDLSVEIKGMKPELLEKYSKRSQERDADIEAFVRREGYKPSNGQVAVLVRGNREDSLREVSTAEVKQAQRDQLTPEEAALLRRLKENALGRGALAETGEAGDSFGYAKEHVFARVSVAREQDVLEAALIHGRGLVGVDHHALKIQLQAEKATGAVIAAGEDLATRESLEREQKMRALVDHGTGRFDRLGGENRQFVPVGLSPEQGQAVAGILNSRDLAVCLQGAAGTGKTKTLQELQRGLMDAGREVFAVAPTQTAVDEMKASGLDQVKTIRALLDSPNAEKMARQVLLVDEAAMVGGNDMVELLSLAQKHRFQLVLVGDTRQLQSVDATDSLRILQSESKLKTFRVTEIFRQKGAYKAAMQALRDDPAQGFAQLEAMGAVHEIPYLDRPEATLAAYLHEKAKPGDKGKERSVLVVAPTWEEIGRFTSSVREHRKAQGELTGGRTVERFDAENWTEAQRGEARNFKGGEVLVFHKAAAGIKKREALTVVRAEGEKIIARAEDGRIHELTKKQRKCFGVFSRETIEVALGDRLMLLENRSVLSSFRATNGELVTVTKIDGKGIHVRDDKGGERVMPSDYRQFTHGYATTAHRSQGKTVDAVIVSGDRMNRELFYVAATRGRDNVTVITSNKEQLRDSIGVSGARRSAADLARAAVQEKQARKRHRHQTVMEKATGWARKQAVDAWQRVLLNVGRKRDDRTRKQSGPQQDRGHVHER